MAKPGVSPDRGSRGLGAAQAVLSQREVVALIVSLLPHRFLNLPPEPIHEARSADGG